MWVQSTSYARPRHLAEHGGKSARDGVDGGKSAGWALTKELMVPFALCIRRCAYIELHPSKSVKPGPSNRGLVCGTAND